MSKIERRRFLKLAAIGTAATLIPDSPAFAQGKSRMQPQGNSGIPQFLVVAAGILIGIGAAPIIKDKITEVKSRLRAKRLKAVVERQVHDIFVNSETNQIPNKPT